MKRLIPLACAVLVTLGQGRAGATSILVDQAQMTVDGFLNLRASGVTGQEFTPTLPFLDVVELVFEGPGGTFPPDVQADFSVGIHVGTISGALIGTSASVSLLTGIFREMVRFEFVAHVALVPGDVYVIEINRLSADSPFSIGSSGFGPDGVDRYALGRGIVHGQPDQPTFDLVFREGLRTADVIPEPRTLILSSTGLVAVLTSATRRRPRSVRYLSEQR
jgi:hypothetical protein